MNEMRNEDRFSEEIEILIDEDRIAERVRGLASALDEALDVLEGPVTLVPVMTGSMLFTSDLIRHMDRPMRIAPVTVQSYPGSSTRSRGARLQTPLPDALRGTNVIIVDDILDSGGTLATLRRLIGAVEPASITACVLLRKNVEHDDSAVCEHAGFDIPDEFVVGYGLDYDGLYRNLPFIGILPEHLVNEESS